MFMSLLDKGLKRRDFLKGTAAAAAAATAAAGLCRLRAGHGAPAWPRPDGSATCDGPSGGQRCRQHRWAGEWMPIHCHQNCNQMCLNMGYVVDGVVVRQKTDDTHADSFDCPAAARLPARATRCASRCTTPTASSTP